MSDPVESEVQRYVARTKTSARVFRAATQVLPGGDTRTTLHYDPYPLYVERGAGVRAWDVDGNEYLDFSNNHTALVHGHAFAPVVEAVRERSLLGTCFGTPSPVQVDAAQCLTDRVQALDLVRFCNSGTEAMMQAVRAARAVTGRPVIAKAEGAYHGSQDDVLVSTHPGPAEAGPIERPNSIERCAGLGRGARSDTVVFAFNDVDAAVSRLREVGSELAAVLVEPVMGSAGMIPIDPQYLSALRELTTELRALLVVDEVITLRLSMGGAQEWFGIGGDLVCFGKMLGGGLPLGALGGRAEVMERFDPSRPDPLVHPGSMNANPLALVASQVTLDELTPQRIGRLNDAGAKLRGRLADTADARGVPLTVTGEGSLLGMHFTSDHVTGFRDTWNEDRRFGYGVFLGLLNEGILIDSRGVGCLSTQTSQEDLDSFVHAFDAVLGRLVAS